MKRDEKMMESFILMDKNKEIARVSFSMEGNNYAAVVEKIHPNHPAYQPFSYKEDGFTRGDILDFLKDRSLEECRPDKKEILDILGLEDYNPINITKKTHGRMMHDFFWIKWNGEALTWEDILNEEL